MNIHQIDAENYRRAVEWAKHADTRASIILAFNAALVALLLTDNHYTQTFFDSISTSGISDEHAVGLFFFIGFLIAFFLSSASALRVLMLDARKTRCEINAV